MSISDLFHPRRRESLDAAYARGRRDARAEDVAFLQAQADLHHGRVGDQRRRAALHYAASLIRDGHPPQRPSTHITRGDTTS